MKTEILIYGLPEGETREYMETILYGGAESIEQAERIMEILARDHGCTKMRIWTFDGSAPNFAATVAV